MSVKKFLKNKVAKVLFGLLLIPLSLAMLAYNEYNMVVTADALDEGEDAVVSVDASPVDPDNDGELVHFTGDIETGEELGDALLPAVRHDALMLRRTGEMYQFEETERTDSDGDTEYRINEVWHSGENQIRHHRNVENPEFEEEFHSETQYASEVTVGDFEMSDDFVGGPLTPGEQEETVELDESVLELLTLEDGYIEDPPRDFINIEQEGDTHYVFVSRWEDSDSSLSNPEIGDYRIKFELIEPYEATVIGEQHDGGIRAWEADAGRDVKLATPGEASPEEMFEEAHAENVTTTWVVRFFGLVMLFSGFMMATSPIAWVARFIPVVGRVIIGAKALAFAAITLILGGGTIAVSWVVMRPLIGVPLLLVFLGAGGALFYKAMQSANDAELEEEPAGGPGGAHREDIGNV